MGRWLVSVFAIDLLVLTVTAAYATIEHSVGAWILVIAEAIVAARLFDAIYTFAAESQPDGDRRIVSPRATEVLKVVFRALRTRGR